MNALSRMLNTIRCFSGLHPWKRHMDNLQGIEEGKPVTVCWKQCNVCGKSKLVFMYANGHT